MKQSAQEYMRTKWKRSDDVRVVKEWRSDIVCHTWCLRIFPRLPIAARARQRCCREDESLVNAVDDLTTSQHWNFMNSKDVTTDPIEESLLQVRCILRSGSLMKIVRHPRRREIRYSWLIWRSTFSLLLSVLRGTKTRDLHILNISVMSRMLRRSSWKHSAERWRLQWSADIQ